MSRDFGIYPDGFNPRQWWGARALIEHRNGKWRFALLPDRQNYECDETVTDTDRADFFCWMENEMDKALQERVRVDYKFREEDVLFTLDSQSGRFHCEARSRNSGGYLYIGVWETEEVRKRG